MKLLNKVAVITGSSRGIGKSTALLFAKEGADIVVNYFVSEVEPNAEENAFAVVEAIKQIGNKAIAVQCDVSKEEQVKKMMLKAMDTFGRIDILVNNAGIVFDVPFFEKTLEEWNRTMGVNLFGTFLCSKYAAEHILKNENGKIISISSTNGMNCFNPESVDYDASKAGIINLTKNLAKELAPNIQVNSVAPGWVNTEMNNDLPQEFIDEQTEKIHLKRFAEPEEIANIVLFLASDDANYITGTTIVADGGYS